MTTELNANAQQIAALVEAIGEAMSAEDIASLTSMLSEPQEAVQPAAQDPAAEQDQPAQEANAKPRSMSVSFNKEGANMFGSGANYIATSLAKRGHEIEVKTATNGVPYVSVPTPLVAQAMGIAKSGGMEINVVQPKAKAEPAKAVEVAEQSAPQSKPAAKAAAMPEMSQAEMALVVAQKNLLRSGGDRVDDPQSPVAFGLSKQGQVYVVDKRIGERGMVVASGNVSMLPNGQVKVAATTDRIAEANALLPEGTKQHDWSRAYKGSLTQIEQGITAMQKATPAKAKVAAGRE